MAIVKNALTYGYGFNITAAGPVDSRMRVPKKSDLTTVWDDKTAPAYAGLSVLVCEENVIYALKTASFDANGTPIAADPTLENSWVKIGDNSEIIRTLATKSDTGHTHDASAITAGTINIGRLPIGTTDSTVAIGNHTHNYAGSASVGGSAISAVKLDTASAGATNKPVYFKEGKPAEISYEINKNVPSNAVFTDTATTQDGHYVPSATAVTAQGGSGTLDWEGTITIPSIKFDNKGHYVSSSTTTYTMPTNPDTWRPVYNGVDSTSTISAATANAVKTAYDAAVAAQSTANAAQNAATTAQNTANGKYTAATATTSTYGLTQLSTATNSTSTSLAATPSAVKAAYDLANGKWTAVTGTSATTGYGIAKLISGDLNGKTYAAGEAASAAHTHGQYLIDHQTIYSLTAQAGAFTAVTYDPNAAAKTINIPTKTSHLTNDSDFITSAATVASANTAASAARLTNINAIGSENQPVYFNSSGQPVTCTYTLAKSVPSNAKFTDSAVTSTYDSGTTSYLVGAVSSGTTTTGLTKSSIYMSGNTLHGCTGYYQDSDERLKTFHGDVEVDFEKLLKLPKAYFTWNNGNEDMQMGTSAQKVRELYPELVSEDDTGKLSVDYSKLSVIALKGLDILYSEIQMIKKHLNL